MRIFALLLLAAAASAQDYEQTRARARELRREEGYQKAIEFLEGRLDHPLVLRAYADCCLWGGEEERGLRGLRGAKVAEAERADVEIQLLVRLFRHREAAEVARRHGWTEAAEWWGDEAALRDRLRGRERRAWCLAAAGAAALLAAWALLRWAFRPSSARATA